ncbi:hypothetical protein R70723_17385 [Paenibacillus sp. FSL R7-0273]|uniref:DUF3169 family protein n=1 Tax=Paenibacillus sp. FSL R7-0273 TaxID=1536772 RepID=UPI0004F8C2BA|nr:DUF3169 family protein [Paenibacillus sp. FSL R7-0273]AIQ47459.1 hypothetical protein R70723_17385 [Paenibacillus sp. FSL R7-0273]OMF95980.1 hypothetical protein BK144_05195 [Paenibacillus sp. FSL R7-0273]
MDKTNKQLNVQRVTRIMLWAMLGAVIGSLLALDLIKVPQDVDFTISFLYEYDLLFGLLAFIVLVLLVWNVKGLSRLHTMNGEHEDIDLPMTPKEKLLSTLLKISTYNTIVSIIWLFLAIALALDGGQLNDNNTTYMLVNLVCSWVMLFIAVYLQKRTVKVFNKVYPNRMLNFNTGSQKEAERELFANMDEGERWIVYRSAYSAYKATSKMLLAGILIFVLYSVIFGFAPLPIIVLGIIWLVQHMAYYREVSRQCK